MCLITRDYVNPIMNIGCSNCMHGEAHNRRVVNVSCTPWQLPAHQCLLPGSLRMTGFSILG